MPSAMADGQSGDAPNAQPDDSEEQTMISIEDICQAHPRIF
jgi:hypothetical protein